MKISKFFEQYFKHILISTYQKIVPLLKNAHCELSSFKPGILLNMPAGLWVPAVKLCCSWQGLVSKMRYGVSDLSSVLSQPWPSQCLFFLHPVYTKPQPRLFSVGWPEIAAKKTQAPTRGSHGVQDELEWLLVCKLCALCSFRKLLNGQWNRILMRETTVSSIRFVCWQIKFYNYIYVPMCICNLVYIFTFA